MPIIRKQKEELVDFLSRDLQSGDTVIVSSYYQLDAKKNETLRLRAFDRGGKVKMVSNNILKLIFKRLNYQIDELPTKPLFLLYNLNDEVEAAKLIADFAKETKSVEFTGAVIRGEWVSADRLAELAKLPPREILEATLLGRLKGLLATLAYNLNFPITGLYFALNNLAKQNGQQVS